MTSTSSPTKKLVEKLKYTHRNPVARGLVESPENWRWSSYRLYLLDEPALVRVSRPWRTETDRASHDGPP